MDKQLPFIKKRLFSPGPTPVPLASMLATMEQTAYHRTSAFYKTFLQCRELLAPLFGSTNLPLILTASGTGAMEAALVNLTAPGDQVLCLVGGKFGERWQEMALAFGCQAASLDFPWGQAPTAAAVVAALQAKPATKVVFLQANETSTGVALPVAAIAQSIRQVSEALIVVDAISSLGAQKMEMDRWGIDVVLSGSQKGFGTPPGLAFIALSPRAWGRLSQRPRYYFDLQREAKGQDQGESAYTPASSLVACLASSLAAIHEVGVPRMLAYHESVAAGVRAALVSLGFQLLAPHHPSAALTAAYLPAGVDFAALNSLLRGKYGQTFAGGQGALKGKIIRFAHLGLFDYFDVAAGIVAMEQALAELGHKHSLGQGIGSFMQSIAGSGL